MDNNCSILRLSFVVPCYNVEKYIQRCLDSIYSCGLDEKQFEVLCVNDCSPDNTIIVLEQNQRVHDNLRIINHESNKGLGGGRNTGIKEAQGKYLWFVDSDDEVVGEGLVEALVRLEQEELEVLCFNYCRIDDEGKELTKHKVFQETQVANGYSFAKEVFPEGIIYHMGFVWRFLYNTSFLRAHRLWFPERVHWEDTVFMPKSILLAERIASVSQVLYSYRVNPDSISGTFGKVYPAKSLFDYAFCSGADLLRFSGEVKDKDLALSFRNSAIHKYINGFAIHLFRTSKMERKRFYGLCKERKGEVMLLKQYMSTLNRVLLMPIIGPMTAGVLSLGYRITHKKKHV